MRKRAHQQFNVEWEIEVADIRRPKIKLETQFIPTKMSDGFSLVP